MATLPSNWDLSPQEVDALLNGQTSWSYIDGNPYANLTLSDGQKWNPSGAASGINLYKKGARKELIPGVKGDAETASVYSDPYTQDTYEISGDLSNLTGTPGSSNHVNISYVKQGDKLVPVEAPGFWNWNDNHRADNMSLLTSAALMAPAVAGFSGVGLGGLGGATAVDGIATGVTTGAEAAAQGGSLMSTLAPYEAGAQLVGNGLGAFAPAEAAGSNLVGNGMGAFAPGTSVSTVSTGGMAPAAVFGGSDLLKGAGLLAGAVSGSKPTTTSNTTQSKTDPRLDPYIYGDQGILAQAQQWQQANRTGLNPQMTRGLNTLTDIYTNPANKQGYQSMQNLGLGLMSSPIAGNPYTRK